MDTQQPADQRRDENQSVVDTPDYRPFVQTHSEPLATSSEQMQNGSERIRNDLEDRSEVVRNNSELVPNDVIETVRTAPVCSEQHTDCSITVREAARIFEEAGVPRTERAITKWCNQNARGITRLTCCYNEIERKYHISPMSIDKVIKEERHKFQYTEYQSVNLFSEAAEDLAERVRNDRESSSERSRIDSEQSQNGSEQVQNSTERVLNSTAYQSERVPNDSSQKYGMGWNPTSSEQNTTTFNATSTPGGDSERQQLKDLQMENFNLRVQLEGQKYLVKKYDELVDGERARHEREKLLLVDRLTDARHQIGSLEQQLLQLEGPRVQPRDATVNGVVEG